ncbi:hypothetical protein FHR32_008054 [Streptosporangium album]|uniref:JmjC domain-containing protein n=1 Tax=Streptosporangium album TaxID=47479 RepID=A0A7W7S4B6_9ACTN|nr:cupin domain-containing protein [Streptosporangium album]MBB4943654.1 hypothetical protein [Streptosporangium album]
MTGHTTAVPVVDFDRLPADWGHGPCILRGLDGVDAVDTYGILRRIGAAVRDGTCRRPDDVKVFTVPQVAAELGEYLPGPGESEFGPYARRVSQSLDVGWSVVANSAQSQSTDLYRFARDVFIRLRGTERGLPAGISDCFIVAGSYASGPTRIHKDTADVFLYVAEGVKTMLLWPFETLAGQAPDDCDPGHEYVALGIGADAVDTPPLRLTGGPGDVLYWPASYWHCGESDGQPSLSLHLATHNFRDMGPVWAGAFTRAGLGAQAPRWSTTERELAADALTFGRTAASAATSAVHQWSVTRHSTANFEILPDFPRCTPPDWQQAAGVRAAQRTPVSWAPDAADPNTIIVAVNGRSFRIAARQPSVSLLSALDNLAEGAVLSLDAWRGTDGLPADVVAILDVAYVAGAVDAG